MSQSNYEQAKQFLQNISSKDKIAIIHHDDGDGFCSAILFNDYCISKNATTKTFSYNLSESSLKTLPLNPFNKIIITDISSKAIQEEITSIKNKQIFYTDHHPKFALPENVLQLITTDDGYLPSSRTAYEIVGGKKWIAIIGALSDAADLYKENNEFIKDFLQEEKLTLIKFQTKYVYTFSDTIIYFKDTPEKIFPILSKLNSLKEVQKLKKYSDEIKKTLQEYEKKYETEKEEFENISFFYYKSKFQINKPLINIISRKNPEKTHIFLVPKEKLINFSARNQKGKIELNKLLETATKNLENAKSGGHPRASGGQIQAKDLEKFKENIKNCLKKQLS